jgi:lactate dehydrogenase-like 2-hydroxyacid dehydrogenase
MVLAYEPKRVRDALEAIVRGTTALTREIPPQQHHHERSSREDVTAVIGRGLIGQAVARRVSVGKHVLLADVRHDNADAAAEILGKCRVRGERWDG